MFQAGETVLIKNKNGGMEECTFLHYTSMKSLSGDGMITLCVLQTILYSIRIFSEGNVFPATNQSRSHVLTVFREEE